ncbi:clathrin-coated vesicle protein [Rhodotorula toruloides]|uniref:Clathrin-coated vesicle protein n=1 Tax=Rhodotorula toruloides TaxID=5286 RepID=A0A511KPG3_RHOTO|nr:clathrin-coated vesicle protein [Rhodotorula toruloides]
MTAPAKEPSLAVEDIQFEPAQLEASTAAGRGEIWLLSWLSKCEKAVKVLPEATLFAEQASLTDALVALVTPPSPTVTAPTLKPGRPARALVARILIVVFSRGDSKALFDVAQSLLRGMNGSEAKGAPEREKEWRIASAYVLGELYAVFGSQILSLYIDLIQATTRIFRTTSSPVILRCSALVCLRKVIVVVAKSMSDQTVKDVMKTLKAGLSEKAGAIVRVSADCLLAMSAAVGTYATLTDINEVLLPSFRALEPADFTTRRSLARLISGILASTQVEGSAAPAPAPKKKKAGKEEEEEDDGYPEVGAPSTSDASSKTLLSPIEMLAQLSGPYNRSISSRRLRNVIIDVYAELFKTLGSAWVEHHYAEIVKNAIDELGCGMAAGLGWIGWNARAAERIDLNKARYEAVAARKAVGILLGDVVSAQLLSEAGQISALREVGTLYLKNWPSLMPNQPGPSKQALLLALEETTNLLRSLGCAPPAVQDVLYDPLVRLVSHPSHSVQIIAAWTLRTFCKAAPNRLSGTIVQLLELLNKDLSIISSDGPNKSATVHRRAIGHAHGLAALVNLIPHKPLYVSFDLSAKCMSLAIQLLKQSGNHELHVSGVEIQVAWILVGSLMSLGPNFVRLHLPQLLILWRNALPKVTSKDASAAQVRGDNEWAFLLHIRECTLGAILSFLRHNRPGPMAPGLVNEDVARRLVMLLSNGLAFSATFATSHPNLSAEHQPSISSRLQLVDRDIMFRRRLLQCFAAFGQSPATQQYQIPLLQQAVQLISDTDRYFGESVLQAVANSATFTSIWDETDGYGYGVTSLVRDDRTAVAEEGDQTSAPNSANNKLAKLNRDAAAAKLDEQLRKPVLEAGEYDPLVLWSRLATDQANFEPLLEAPPPAVGVVDASLELFSLYFSLQEPANQYALLQILHNNLRSFKLEKNPGRKQAILVNSVTAVLGALRLARRAIDAHQVASPMRDLIKEALLHSDTALRQAAAESLGRLSSLGGTSFMAGQIQFCVQQVVSNTDPDNRAGCALAFSEIYSHVGSLAAAPVLKTVVDILLSLSADPHPLVHYHALQSLSNVIDVASLSYAPLTNPTLGVLCKLYMQDTHEPEGGTPGSVNLRGDLPAYQAMCRVMDALIGVLGPELQDSERVRELVLILLKEFTMERDDGIAVEAIKATQHFLIFAPDALDHTLLVSNLRAQLSSTKQPLKVAAVNSVYQLVQRDAALMSKLGGDGLVRELFALLDDDPTVEGVRDAIISWLRQTADANPSGWIDLCQRIMSRSADLVSKKDDKPALEAAPIFGALADEEAQGLGVEADTGCLHEVFATVVKSGRREHFDVARARVLRANKRGLLITRVADLIKMAFTASTAQVMEIRLEGLVVLKDVIDNFAASQDVDFEDALLLEQYQAPIAAALTPAFAVDSYPEVLASAIQVCAVFVGSGVVKEIEKMGRILKLLTSALVSCKDSDMTSLGDVKDLSTTAAVMLKTSIFAAWAQFQTSSVNQPYLADVIRPHLPLLCPFWVASLHEYVRVRTDPVAASSDAGAGGAAFDSVYSGLSRETALPFYERSWPQMLHAVATLLKASNPHMLRAIDGLEDKSDSLPSPHRSDPAVFFWNVFGLSFEALCTTPSSANSAATSIQTIALEALGGLLRRDVAGTVLNDQGLFDEVCNLCLRLALTEAAEVKARVLDITARLVQLFVRDLPASSAINDLDANDKAARVDRRLIQCLRIAIAVLRESVPASSTSLKPTAATAAALAAHIRHVFSRFADVADLLPSQLRVELYAIAFHSYSTVLRDEKTEIDFAGPTLPVLKTLCDKAAARPGDAQTLSKVLNGVLSACLLNIDAVRVRKSTIAIRELRNNLLAVTLLLTALPPGVQVGSEVVEHACFLVSEIALDTTSETSGVALNCFASLLLGASRSPQSDILAFCATQFVPAVVELVALTSLKGSEVDEVRLKAVDEVLKAFVAVLAAVAPERKTQSLSVILPTLVLVLSTSRPPPPLHTIALNYLLTLATSLSLHFKEATAALPEDQRKLLEDSIRAAVGGKAGRGGPAVAKGQEEAPRIELRMFG